MAYFPFESIRNGQEEFIKDLGFCLEEGKHIIAHAPTGIGKTAAVLATAIETALKKDLVIFFLTPKHTQHNIVMKTVQKINEKHNLNIRFSDFIGKKWMCLQQNVSELSNSEFNEYCRTVRTQEVCEYYNNTYQKAKITDQVKDFIKVIWNDNLDAVGITKANREREKQGFCPYEVNMMLAKDSRVIIGDYYHLFSPQVRSAFLLKLGREAQKIILIVDEAHNLPERLRSLLSDKISSYILSRAEKEAKAFNFQEIANDISYINVALKNIAEKLEFKNEVFVRKFDFIGDVEKTTQVTFDALIDELEEAALEVRKSSKKSYLGGLAQFLELWKGEDVGYARILKREYYKDKPHFVLEYSCLNPALAAKEFIDSCYSAVFMSGTLKPGEMYRDLLGLSPIRTIIREYPSPFDPKNRLVLVDNTVTTKYSERNEEEFKKIAKKCKDYLLAAKVKTVIFFPSYEFMHQVLPFFNHDIESQYLVLVEDKKMSKEEKDKVLEDFKKNQNAVLLGVLGGNFSEGIDLPGKYLEMVIVVGLPLSRPDLLSKALVDYYDYAFKKGFEYGYTYPAMIKVMQAVGRCIRTTKDRGVIILMDKRYTYENFQKVLPRDWDGIVITDATPMIKRFFPNK